MTAILMMHGCAGVDVSKVGDKDRAKGFRFYLPRPYVAVKKPFPIGGDDFFVVGKVLEGNVVGIDLTALPEALRAHFGGDATGSQAWVPFGAVRVPEASQRYRQHAEGGDAKGDEDEKATTSELASDDATAGSKVDPPLLPADKTDFTVTAVLAKGSGFTQVGKVQVGLVPVTKDGAGGPDTFVGLPDTSKVTGYEKDKTDGSYTARGRRSDVAEHGADFAVALKVSGRRSDAAAVSDWVVHGKGVAVHVVGAPAGADGKKGKKGEKGESVEKEASSKSDLETSGDPSTTPVIPINDFFDVVMLPDFDEKYTIDLKAGIGSANGKIGFENGWMVEHASVGLDNKEIGKFIFSSAEKVVDLGVELAKAALEPASVLSDALKQQAEAEAVGTSVLLRVRFVVEALPGLYPILKPTEMPAKDVAPPAAVDRWLFIPYRPYTTVAYQVRRTVLIDLVSVGAKAQKPATEAIGTRSNVLGETEQKLLGDRITKILGSSDLWNKRNISQLPFCVPEKRYAAVRLKPESVTEEVRKAAQKKLSKLTPPLTLGGCVADRVEISFKE